MWFQCNPMEALHAQLAAENEAEQLAHDFHQDSVVFPETRCGICQCEDPAQELTCSGGVQMCSGCLTTTLDET
jgi:hypothetical protein